MARAAASFINRSSRPARTYCSAVAMTRNLAKGLRAGMPHRAPDVFENAAHSARSDEPAPARQVKFTTSSYCSAGPFLRFAAACPLLHSIGQRGRTHAVGRVTGLGGKERP